MTSFRVAPVLPAQLAKHFPGQTMQVSEPAPQTAEPSAYDTAEYIGDMARQLAGLARVSRLDTLAALLDIARLEAGKTSGRPSRRVPVPARSGDG